MHKAWLEQFPLLFDTRFLAQEGRLQVLKHTGGLSLDVLHKHMRGQTDYLKLQRFSENPEGSMHSAGFDATVTAELFVMEVDKWIRFDERKGSEPNTQKTSCEANDEKAGKTNEDRL